MSIQFHAGYWTIFIAGKPVMSFRSKDDARAMLWRMVPAGAQMLYLLLWTVTDDNGRFRGAADFLAQGLFPQDTDSQERVRENLQTLEAAGFIRQKFSEQGAFIAIPDFAQCPSP